MTRTIRLVCWLTSLSLVSGLLVTTTPVASAAPWTAPSAQDFDFVDVKTPTGKRVTPKQPTYAKLGRADWPKPGRADVPQLAKGRTESAGTLPVEIGVPEDATTPASDVQIEIVDQAVSAPLVGPGVVLAITSEPGAQASVELDYSAFAHAGGADFGARLGWVVLPDCALDTPELPECATGTPVESANSVEAETVRATIQLPDGPETATAASATMLLAAVAGTSSEAGNWSATSLRPASLWQAGGSSGAFTWGYPLRVPSVAGALTPGLQITYNSGSTDGVVSSTNNQASWVGEGFDLSMGFIERTYTPCVVDKPNKGTSPTTSEDLCWFSDSGRTNNAPWDNAVLNVDGRSSTLVRMGNTNTWRMKEDDGTRIEKLGAPAAGSTPTSEYWKMTTPDGTQYFFGKGKADGAQAAATNARWLVPVAANHSGEPGYNATFASSFASQAWRWNMDYVVAPSGDTMTVYYDKETNKYKQAGVSDATYDRGGVIGAIHYGERQGAEASAPAAKVAFVAKERCDTSVSSSCETSQPTSVTASAWPDVPTDAICEATYCPAIKNAPTFFTRKRLAQVNTFSRNTADTGYDPVDTWDLTPLFPNSNAEAPTLWLWKIAHTGQGGTPITLPAVTLEPSMYPNRVAGVAGAMTLYRPRLWRIYDQAGSRTTVHYTGADPECTPTSLPADPASNTTRCFPSYYAATPGATPTVHWFAKYVVSKIEEYDTSSQTYPIGDPFGLDSSDTIVTNYSYGGGAAWRWDDSVLSSDDLRTWNVWRGYGDVTTTVGKPGSTQTITKATWLRGMNGDRANAAGTSTKTVSVTDSTGASIPDDDWLSGYLRESRLMKTAGGAVDSRTINDLWTQSTSGATDGRFQARMVAVEAVRATQFLASGSRSATITTQARDAWGQPTRVEETGDTAITGDEKCLRISYAVPSGSATAINLVAEQSIMPGLCAASPENTATALSWEKHFYDGATTSGGVAGPGLETRADLLTGSSSRTWRTVLTVGYDQHGRATSVTNAVGKTATIGYSPATLRAPRTVTATTPDPDGAGAGQPLVTTTTYDHRSGVQTKVVAPGGQTAEASLDGLGRVTAVWAPGRAKASQTPSVKYSYVVNQSSTGVSGVKTESLLPNGTGYLTSWTLTDSLARVRQVQNESVSLGSQIQDVRYDSRGNPVHVDEYLISALPSSTMVAPLLSADVKRSVRSTYDYAGRSLTESLYSADVLQWQTSAVYGGDRVAVTPPQGGTPTTSVFDIRGRTTQLIEHLGTTTAAPGATASYTYTPAGQLATMTDPKGNVWKYSYDVQGNLLSASDPDTGVTTMTYNTLDQLVTTTDARGKGVKTEYDSIGRQVRTASLTDTTLTKTVWDTLSPGLITSTSSFVQGSEIKQQVNSYDGAGRPTSTSTIVPAVSNLIPSGLAGTYTVTSSYNPNGTVASVGLPATGPINAETLTYGYNAKGAPVSLTGMATIVKATSFTKWDTVSSIAMGAVTGQSITAMFDRQESTLRLTKIRSTLQAVSSSPVEEISYRYDPVGNIIQAKAAPLTGAADNQCFQYDYQRQLKAAFTAADTVTCDETTAVTQSSLGSGPSPYWTTWATDTIGKASQRTDRTASSAVTTSYTYPADGATSIRPHAVTSTTAGSTTRSYGYDAAGNTVSRPNPAGVVQTLSYDDRGRLTQVTAGGTVVLDAVYDATGERIVKREAGKTTLTVAGTQLVIDNTSGVKTASRYYSHAGRTVAVRTGNTSAELFSILTDHQGTAHHQVRNSDSQRTTVWQNPYGDPRGGAVAGWAGDRGFVDGVKDSSTGLTHLGARDYDPVLQRFTTPDPLLDVADPVQWNAYLYSNNNPVTFSDPTGLMACTGSCGKPQTSSSMTAHPITPSASASGKSNGGKTTGGNSASSKSSNAKTSSKTGTIKTTTPRFQFGAAGWIWNGGLGDDGFSGDGAGGGEGGNWTPDEDTTNPWVEGFHIGFDIAGLVPGYGEVFDLINTVWYALEGDKTNAALSGIGIIPFLGWLGTGGKLLGKLAKRFPHLFGWAAKGGDDVLDAARAARDAKAAEVGRDKATVTAGYGRDGRIVTGCSSNPVGCAEDDVARQIGGNPKEISFTEAVRPRTGREVPICPSCQGKYDQGQFPPGTLFHPEGLWKK